MLAGDLIKTGEIGSGLRKLGTAWPDFPEIVKTPNSRWQTIYVR
ncbi:virulence protein [Mobiluncus mulieris]|uniref:Virulence protein n=1 Tax=Mobiluncus mulieris TaxID=2052 RepID=A0A7Y0U256_9ACTO|nr:virulence protein [Mobiluncus mulieris]